MNYNIGFIGYGKMAKAIAKYLSQNETLKLSASDKYAEIDDVISYDNNAELVKNNEIIFLAVKPQNASEAIANIDFTGKIVISIMAGLKIKSIQNLACNIAKIVRIMPNLCASIGQSTNAYTTIGLNDAEIEVISTMLDSFGKAYMISEEQFDAITGLTGSSPAYIFRFIKDIIECGILNGFSYEQSLDMITNTVIGCANMLKNEQSVESITTLIQNVCSKGGTTIEGIYKLDEGNFDNTVISAIDSAINRSKELSGEWRQ